MKVAVAGLGLMGEPIARRLLAAGHELTVYNRTPGKTDGLAADGAAVASSPADIWATADVCFTVVTGDDALRAVTTELFGTGGGHTVVDMSTVSPAASAEVAAAAAEAGTGYLRAPVSGNPTVVRAGNLAIMVSGERETFEMLEPALRDIGPSVFYVGAGEEARVLKLALNLMIAGTAQLMAEAVVLGEANDLDRATMLEVMGASAVGSPFVKYKTAALVARDYDATFSLANMHKDLEMALGAAARSGVPLPVTLVTDQLVQACIGEGMAETDLMGLVPHLQRDAGVTPDM